MRNAPALRACDHEHVDKISTQILRAHRPRECSNGRNSTKLSALLTVFWVSCADCHMETGTKHLQSGDARQFPWLEAMVGALDDRLRLWHGVIEYTNSPECLFRIQFIASGEIYVLSDGTCIQPGDRVANLHVWNEQFPRFGGNGPTLAWARRVNQAFEFSPGIGAFSR